MLKKHPILVIYLIAAVIFLSACSKHEQKIEKKNFISTLSEQPTSNTAYCYVVSNDKFILKDDIHELVEILQLQNWKSEGKAPEDYILGEIVINFNEFPEGKNEKNFDYGMGTYVTNQLVIQAENYCAFRQGSDERYLLNSDIVNALQTFISKKAVSNDELIERMK